MNDQKDITEAAFCGSALTAELGTLADQFECHAASRSIGDVEAAGRAMRAAVVEIERLQTECTCAAKDMPFGRCCKLEPNASYPTHAS